MTTPEHCLVFLATLLVACAGPPPSSVRPPPADTTTDPLPCVGRSRRSREHDPTLGTIHVRTWCEWDHVIVERRGSAWAEHCLVEREHALTMWDATRRDQVAAVLAALPGRAASSLQPAPPPDPQPPPEELLVPMIQTSCPCPRAGDSRGEHCWDHPCDPPRLPDPTPTSPTPC
ncbi:hypothetical protein [Nannocystis exedens]|nr:hypothetical protein [Nannocystis exedens]